MTSFDDLVHRDLQLMISIEDYCARSPWIKSKMNMIISKHPWQDICAIIWVFFVIGLIEQRRKHFWVVAVNLALCSGIYYG